MGVFSKIKKWLTKKPKDDKIKEANRVTNYGGGASSKSVQKEVKRSIVKAEAKKRGEKQTKYQQSAVSKSNNTAFKATPPSVRKAEAKDRQTSKKSDAFNAKNAFKASAQPKFTHQSTALGTMSKRDIDTRTAKMNAYNENRKYQSRTADSLKPLIDEKYSQRRAGAPAYVKQGNYAADPLVAKYNVLKHPYATSAARGATNAATLGLSDLAISKLSKGEAKEAEQFYQANKSKGAETAGMFAGSVLPYGLTAGAFENLGTKAVGRAAETAIGRKLGAEALGRVMAGEGAKAAIARSLVGDAIQDSTIGLVDTMADVAARDDLETAGDYAKAILAGQALNYGMGLAGNAVAHGMPVVNRAWDNYADESRRLYFVPKGTMAFMDDFMGDLDNGARRNLVMNGGTTKANRLQGVSYANGTKPKKLGKTASKAEPPKVKAEEIKKPAEVMQGYSSKGSKKRISEVQKKAKKLIADGDMEGARREVSQAVDEIVRNTRIAEPLDDTTKEIKEYLKNTKISVSDKADIGYKSGSFDAFRKKHFGSLNLTEDGRPVDDLWGALQERYGTSLFPEEIENPSDQLRYLSDIAKKKSGKEYELADDELLNLKNSLNDSIWHDINEKPARGAKSKAKSSEPKDAQNVVDNNRYDELVAERDRLMDEIFSKNEKADPEALKRINELNEEIKKLNPKAADKKARTKSPKAETKAEPKAEVKAEKPKTETPKAETKAESPKPETKAKAETKAEPPKAKDRKQSKSELRLKEVDKEIKKLDDEIDKLTAAGAPREDKTELMREANALRKEKRQLERNIERAEKARAKRAAEKASKSAEPPKAKTEEPETNIVAKGEAAETGEKAKAGKRTEFKRNEEPSAKEQARNKRAEKRTQATQEDFDRDFNEFVKKVEENREKVSNLNGRLRAAATEEERQAIKKEIEALDAEIKRMHRKASLRYHPDMGGSNEWAQKFNTVYDSYTKRVYSSPNFSGASSKSSSGSKRNNTYKEYRQTYRKSGGGANTPPPKSGAGGGGANTPPPKGGEYADYDGLRRPKGYAKRTQRAMEDIEDMVGATKPNTTWREAGRTFKDEANRSFVDSMKDFEGVARERLKTEGKGAMQKLYGAIDKARRYRAIASQSVDGVQLKADGTRYRVIDENGVERDAPSIVEIFSFKGDKKKEKAFNAYLLLNHNVDRLREGKAVFKDTVLYNEELSKALGLGKDIDLMDADVCKKLAENYEAKYADFKSRAAQVRQYTANELNNRVQAGLLSKEDMDELLHKYPNYVPTYREGLFDSVSAIKGTKITAGDYKAAKGSDLNILDIKEQLADATVRNWRDMTLNNLLEQTFGKDITRNLTDIAGNIEGAHILALDHTMNVGKAADGSGYYAIIHRDGKPERVPIEKRFYDDIKDLYKNGRLGNGLDVLNDKVLVPLASTWKKLITEWSPIFMIKNPMRDFPEAIINSRARKEFLHIMADGSALKDLISGGEYSTMLRDAGISASTFTDLNKAIKEWEKGDGSLLKLLPKLNAGVEMYPRLIEYMATLKKAGYDISKKGVLETIPMEIRDMAAANAADVTVNFGRSGSIGKMVNKGAVPFLNPSIQGWSKFARNISELDGFKDTLSFFVATMALGTAPMVATNLLYQNNPNYQQISARDKANNYIIALPPTDKNADKFLKIPRSRFASVYGLPLVNVANENKMGWATAIQVVNDQVAPLNPLESHLGANLIQAARNKTWYGTPIESESMQTLPANERYDATTSDISIKAAQAADKVTKGKVKISPKKLDYVLDANFGVVADFALPMTTKANKNDSVPARFLNVGKKAFTIDSAIQNDISTRYYDKATLLEQNKNSAKATKEDKAAYEKFNSWNNRVKDVTNAMRYVQNSNLPNKQEAYRELRKLRNEDMLKALDGRTSLNNTRDISIIHKYAGTSYTIENLGRSADKKALRTYSAAVYGNLSEKAMKKKIDADTEFYNGYKGVVRTQNALQKVDPKLKGNNALTYAVGLADAGANDDVFASYDTTIKSRTESASKAKRAKEYLKNNGSIGEFAQLEDVVKNLGKVPDVDKDRLEDEAYKKLQDHKMSIDDYNRELDKIDYNANLSYVGKAVSLAMSGAPDRAYNLYDIKLKNVQKGYNLAAMGIDSIKYREMSKACDKDGNGYLKTSEIRDYVANSDVEDKATLFDALCYYPNVRNPFGTPKTYSSEQAAKMGKRNGVKQIDVNGGKDNTKFVEGKESSSNWQGGYYRNGWHNWHSWGGGRSRKGRQPIGANNSAFKAKKANISGGSSPKMSVSGASNISRTSARVSSSPKIDITPLNVKAVKPVKTGRTTSNLSAALEDIKKTESKVKPPKARR